MGASQGLVDLDECRDWWRFYSVRVMAIGIFLNTWIAFDPASVLYVWKMMPAPIAQLIPQQIIYAVSAVLWVLALTLRFTRQKNISSKRSQSDG